MSVNLFNFGSATVDNSITNPSVDKANTLDNFQPFSFFEYLKYSRQVATPEQFTNGYSEYLQLWYATTNTEQVKQIDEIKMRYVDVLKDIALNFTTVDEKRFLSNLDYDNPSDLAIAIPFYARKLKEICLFYTKKRESLKNRAQEVRIKGTSLSIEKSIFQNIIDYVYSANEEGSIGIDIKQLANSLQIDIVDYFDVYSNYFDLDPTANVDDLGITNELRRKYFTSNVNAISAQLFLGFDNAVLAEIFATPFYLKEIGKGLIINAVPFIQKTLYDFNCDINPIAELLNSNLDALSANYELKRRLIKKYIGTDFYYLSTNSQSQFVSGELFKADNPSANLINKRFATTATVPEDELRTAKQLGLFFRPDKMGVIQFAVNSKNYYVDQENLKPNHVYIFPDPDIYGNVSNFYYNNLDYPLQYSLDYSSNIKRLDAGAARGFIKSSEYLQNYFAYFSEPIYVNAETHNVSTFDSAFQRIFDNGLFTQYKQDVYGNEYGLLKDVKRYNQNQTTTNNRSNKCITLDGYSFYDAVEGSNFNYATVSADWYGSIRTGLTAKTIDEIPLGGGTYATGYTFASGGMFSLTGQRYALYFREFIPYIECANVATTYTCIIRDGGQFTAPDNTLLPDVSSDLVAFNNTSKTYYAILCDAGLSATNVLQPGKLACALTATIVAPALSSLVYQSFDGSQFNNNCYIAPLNNYSASLATYFDDINPGCQTVLSLSSQLDNETLVQVQNLVGTILVKNVATNNVMPLSAALSAVFVKYPVAVKNELYSTNIKNFSLIYDCIIIETPHYVVFDRIAVDENNNFIKPGTTNSQITISDDAYEGVSNSFFIESTNDVWTFKTSLLQNKLSATNEKTIFPTIYKYNVKSNVFDRKYPTNLDVPLLSSLFVNPMSGVNIVNIDNLNISYAQQNDKFALSWVGYDMNGMSYIFNAWFDYKGDDVIFDENLVGVFVPDNLPKTYNFANALSSYSTIEILSTANTSLNVVDDALFFN